MHQIPSTFLQHHQDGFNDHQLAGSLMLRQLVVVVTLVFGWSIEARAGLIFSSGSRSVAANAVFNNSGASTTAGNFDESVMSSYLPLGIASYASQNSMTPNTIGPSMTGMGDTGFTIDYEGVGQVGSSGLSYFDVKFTVEEDGMYDIDATVDWSGDFLPLMSTAFNFSIVELSASIGGSQFLVYRDGLSQGTLSSMDTLALETGITYRLEAYARVSGTTNVAGDFAGEASWTFGLNQVSVPEPGGVFLGIMLSAILGTCCVARRRPRGPRT